MAERKKFSLLEKATIAATGVTSFVVAREPLTKWYADFIGERAEINDYLDAVLAAGHVTAAGILAATAIGAGIAYATKKGIDYLNRNEATHATE